MLPGRGLGSGRGGGRALVLWASVPRVPSLERQGQRIRGCGGQQPPWLNTSPHWCFCPVGAQETPSALGAEAGPGLSQCFRWWLRIPGLRGWAPSGLWAGSEAVSPSALLAWVWGRGGA